MAAWSTPVLGPSKERLEVLRDYAHFGEGHAGERVTDKFVRFNHPVLPQQAEVFLSGFNTFYTREGHDHEVMVDRVDAWIDWNGFPFKQVDTVDPRTVKVHLMYHMADEDTSHSDDYNDCYIGFTVLAHTKE